MKNSSILTILFAGVISASATSAQQTLLPQPNLSVTLRSAQSSYSIGGSLSLEIQLENVSDESLLICRSWGWGVGRTYVRVFDKSGKEVFTTFLADQIPPPPRDTDFLELGRNEFFGIRLSESAKHFVNMPGTYDILVEYTSPASEEWVRSSLRLPQMALWSRESGTIVSNRVRIEITK